MAFVQTFVIPKDLDRRAELAKGSDWMIWREHLAILGFTSTQLSFSFPKPSKEVKQKSI